MDTMLGDRGVSRLSSLPQPASTRSLSCSQLLLPPRHVPKVPVSDLLFTAVEGLQRDLCKVTLQATCEAVLDLGDRVGTNIVLELAEQMLEAAWLRHEHVGADNGLAPHFSQQYRTVRAPSSLFEDTIASALPGVPSTWRGSGQGRDRVPDSDDEEAEEAGQGAADQADVSSGNTFVIDLAACKARRGKATPRPQEICLDDFPC